MKVMTLRRQAGFTLIEMMVAVVIGLFLLVVIGAIYVSTTRSFTATNSVTGMDENARAIFDLIGENIRQAGFDGCSRLSGAVNGDIRTGILTRNAANAIINNGNLWWTDTSVPVQGVAAPDSRFPNATAGTGGGAGVLMLVGVDSQKAASVMPATNPPAITTGTTTAFLPGQALLATSCMTNSFFIASAGTTAGKITVLNATGYNCDANLATSCAIPGGAIVAGTTNLPNGALIMPVVAHAYYIAPSKTAGKGNSLWVCAPTDVTPAQACGAGAASGGPPDQELVNGVENLAVKFGLDIGNTGSVVAWVPPPVAAANLGQIAAVQVRLLLATEPDAGAVTSGSNKYTFNGGAPVTPADGRVYREYTATFSVRNKSF